MSQLYQWYWWTVHTHRLLQLMRRRPERRRGRERGERERGEREREGERRGRGEEEREGRGSNTQCSPPLHYYTHPTHVSSNSWLTTQSYTQSL